MLNTHSFLEIELNKELRARNSRLYFPHYSLIAIASYISLEIYKNQLFLIYPLVLVVISLIIRHFILKFWFDKFSQEDSLIHLLFDLAVLTTGLGWGLYYYHAVTERGYFSINGIFALCNILIMMVGITTTLSASLRSSFIFLTSVMVIPIVTFLRSGIIELQYGSILLFGNYIYALYHGRIAHQFLVASISNMVREVKERESLQEFIDTIPSIVAVIDENLTYVMVNNYENGIYRERILGKKVGTFSHAHQISDLIRSFHLSDKREDLHEVFIMEDGKEIWWMMSLKRMEMKKSIIVSLMPITELIETKKELRFQEAKIQYAARLASLGEMAAGIAHEVNNPLTIIEGSSYIISQLVEEETIDRITLKLMSEKVAHTTQRISKIVKSLKSLSRETDAEMITRLKLSSLLGPCMEVSRQKFLENGIEFRMPFKDDDCHIYGRETQITQVLMNLISNSIDAVMSEKEKWIEVDFVSGQGWNEILVKDSGAGVRPDIRHKIMNPFFTTKGPHLGTGLGLSISKNIVETHGGELILLPDTENTTFKIRLPERVPVDNREQDAQPIQVL